MLAIIQLGIDQLKNFIFTLRMPTDIPRLVSQTSTNYSYEYKPDELYILELSGIYRGMASNSLKIIDLLRITIENEIVAS